MVDDPLIYDCHVVHTRTRPQRNQFGYRLHYISVPVNNPLNHCFDGSWRSGFMAFREEDHGRRDGSSLEDWVGDLLSPYIEKWETLNITLIAMPRVLGYVFNPISLWFCRNDAGDLLAVVCEVNNTFGETHSYLCLHDDGGVIHERDRLIAKKVFHVSPFYKREGHYEFSFEMTDIRFRATINYVGTDGKLDLHTSLKGEAIPFSPSAARSAFLSTPLVTAKAMVLIHWQALKLWWRRIVFIPKPPQHDIRHTRTIDRNRNDAVVIQQKER